MVELVIKNPPAKAGDLRDVALVTESGRSSGGGHLKEILVFLKVRNI